ncbi:hypothetical protein ACFU99_26220 [Streptomyces sp. NPDC057654]
MEELVEILPLPAEEDPNTSEDENDRLAAIMGAVRGPASRCGVTVG